MAKADPPLALGEIIDRIEERMREELLILQRSLEKMVLPNPPLLGTEPQMGSRKMVSARPVANQNIARCSIRFRRPLSKLALEMSFNVFMTKRVFRVGQYDRIHDFVAFDLSGKKRTLGEFLVGKFHSSDL